MEREVEELLGWLRKPGARGLRPEELGAIHKFAFTAVEERDVAARERDAEPKPALLGISGQRQRSQSSLKTHPGNVQTTPGPVALIF